jgi:DNA-directed RNA polymerase specialized sigma24 family protein
METQSLPERTLVAKAQAGNDEAFTELVRRHSGQVYGLSLNMLRHREDAEDNLQNVLVKAFHNINRFEGLRTSLRMSRGPSRRSKIAGRIPSANT